MADHDSDALDHLTKRIAERTRRNRYRSAKGEPFQQSPLVELTPVSGEILVGAFIVWLVSSAIIAANAIINEMWRIVSGLPRFAGQTESRSTGWPFELRLIWFIALIAFGAYAIVLWDKWGF